MRLWSAALIAIALVWTIGPQDPQQAPPTPPVFRAGVDVVQVDVSILDANRKPVHGLKKADLRILEDGRPQDVIELDEVSLNDVEPPPVWAPAVQRDIATNDLLDRRLLAIVMDDLHCCGLPGDPARSDRWAIANEIQTAQRFIDNLGPRDLATVVLTHDLVAVERFTDNREELRAVIDRFAPLSEGGCVPQPPIPHLLRDLTELMAMAPQASKAIVILEGSTTHPPVPKCERRSYNIPDGGGRVFPIAVTDPGKPPDPLSLSPVPIYHLYVSGLGRDDVVKTPPALRPIGLNGSGDNPSGGFNFRSTNDLTSAVDQVLAENDSYYLLGFRTSRPTTDGKYRHLDIKVPGHSDYLVRARAGYLRPKPAPATGSRASRDTELARPTGVVSHLLPNFDVTLHASVAAFAAPDRAHDVLVMSVDLDHLVSFATATGTEDLTLRTVAYADGNPKYDRQTSVQLAVPAGSTRVSGSVAARLDVTPERYALWITAHDPRTSLTGGVFYDLDVPDFTAHPISVSGIVLGSEPSAGAPVPPLFAGVVPIVPTASRTFAAGQSVVAFFQVYQGRETPLAPVTVAIRAIDGAGTTQSQQDLTLAPEQFSARRAADVRLPLPLEKLVRGAYLFTVEARLAEHISPKRDVTFSVR